MGHVSRIALTTQQVIDLVADLDHERIAKKTFTNWVMTGLTTASVRYGTRGGRGNHRLFSRGDVARIRLVARLRREGVGSNRIRVMFAYLSQEQHLAAELLKPRTRAALVVNPRSYQATVVRPGQHDIEIPSGQIRLELADVQEGIETAARKLIA